MAFFKQQATDMTKGNPAKMIMIFAVPLFIGNAFQMLYNTVDTMVVGRFVGPHALAAVGGAGVSYSVMLMLINGFMGGASVVIAQAFGAGDRDALRRDYATSCIIIAATGLIFTVLGELLAMPLLTVLATPKDVIYDSLLYLRVMYLGILATSFYNGFASFLRAVGDSTTPLIALVISSCLNVALDLIFVVVFGQGVSGVAWATIISQAVSGLYCFVSINRRMPEFRLQKGELRIDRGAAAEMFRIGVPAAFSSAVVQLSVMLIQRAVNSYGSTVLAAYTAEGKTGQICFCLSYSIGLATGVFVGQNKGARLFARVREGLHAGIRISLLYHAAIAILMLIFTRQLLGLFTTDADVLAIGSEILRINAFASPLLGLNFVFQNFLRNVSDVRPTIWMSSAEVLARGTLPYALGAKAGYHGVWFATPIGWLLSLFIGIARYRSGIWEKKGEISHLPSGN